MNLNGTQVAANADPAWTDVQSFTIPAGGPFQLGANTLTVVVPNSGGNVTGLSDPDHRRHRQLGHDRRAARCVGHDGHRSAVATDQ